MRKSVISALRAFTLRAQVPELAFANLGALWQSLITLTRLHMIMTRRLLSAHR